VTVSEVEVTYPNAGEAVARFIGEHDLVTKAETSDLLARLVSEYQTVTVDLREATFIDSSFLHCLVLADKGAKERGNTFRVLVGAEGPAKSVIAIAVRDFITVVVATDPPGADPLPEDFSRSIST
jgi:anti-anti-sigma regulatory factor